MSGRMRSVPSASRRLPTVMLYLELLLCCSLSINLATAQVTVDHEGNLWLVDDMAHMITKTDKRGNRLMVLAPGGVVSRALRSC